MPPLPHQSELPLQEKQAGQQNGQNKLNPYYAELHCLSNFSFLRGASHPEELVETAHQLGYSALAITDECSMAGVVRAWTRARELEAEAAPAVQPLKLIIGTEFVLNNNEQPDNNQTRNKAISEGTADTSEADFANDDFRLIALACHFKGYSSLCSLISNARRAAEKGQYKITREMIEATDFSDCCLILAPPYYPPQREKLGIWFDWFYNMAVSTRAVTAHVALELHYGQYDQQHFNWLKRVTGQIPLVACGNVHMHTRQRRALQDVLTCVRHGCSLDEAGHRLFPNGEHFLRDEQALRATYPVALLQASLEIASLCSFKLCQLEYQYPREIVPQNMTPSAYLRQLTLNGIKWRWPAGVDDQVLEQIEHELELVRDMKYEQYFLTVYDIVRFARSRGILCQGRGSAANSAVCFVLGITEVDPSRTSMLFERFISKERDEPPDIDVDFEHERREEVIQYIYDKYGRHRAAIAATVVSYRKRSAIRDIGKVLGLQEEQIMALSKSMAWWDGPQIITERLQDMGFDASSLFFKRFAWLLEQILGFPRHLSQHVGGFVIADETLATLVPIENAAMPDRTIIQWDKDDLEELGLLKVDVLALGMLTAIRKCFHLLADFKGVQHTMASIPANDTATYDMICRADTMGVFQIESRAQMSMLPRLQPRNYYDLVIEVAIVRPGPIQGGMVNPYLKRRQGLEPVSYPNIALKRVLERTLGVPVFQEQVMEIAMVAAGFSAGQADQLRRSMAAWRRVGSVTRFRDELIQGMLDKGYDAEFAEAVFRQVEGFGEYGFPESHAASFALLVYVSCWLKCHEPAAFLCAMLNSQPLGFYDPSDLTQDARRHGVKVFPVDVNESSWDHHLVHDDNNNAAVRLGFRLVNKLSRKGAEKILMAREQAAFYDAEDLVRRSDIHQGDQQALSIAGALANISGNRHQAQWDLLGIENLPGILKDASAPEPSLQLPLPTEGENIVADYMSTGLTLGRHPLALLREKLAKRRILSSEQWRSIPNGRHARLAGIIKVRQRPGTATGIVFMTLEDETGHINVVCWNTIVETYRQEVLGATMVAVHGQTQREGDVVHLIARKIEDLSWMLGELSTQSRNFH